MALSKSGNLRSIRGKKGVCCAPSGDVAQLGERRVRNAKVGSSILLVSTGPPRDLLHSERGGPFVPYDAALNAKRGASRRPPWTASPTWAGIARGVQAADEPTTRSS
jgi:hypothetical protein